MFDKIIHWALKNRMLVVALAAALCVYGMLLLRQLPVDIFPDLNRPTVSILTEVEGAAPEDIETLISKPIEAAVNGTPGLVRVFSTSVPGLSIVRAEFSWGTNTRIARAAVSERLLTVQKVLPKGVNPSLSPSSSIMNEVLMIGVTNNPEAKDRVSAAELRTIADWQIRPLLQATMGVGQVTVLGGDPQEIEIALDPLKLHKKQITLTELSEKLSRLSGNSSGGFLVADGKEWLVRNYGRIRSVEDIGMVAIGRHLGQPVLLKDVSQISYTTAPRRGDASINGQAGVVLMIQKQANADTLTLTKEIDRVLAEAQKSLPSEVTINSKLYRQADFIDSAIGNVEEALRDGSLMVAAVLFLFLLNFRTTIIALTAIPISLLVTAIVFHWFDLSINTMTLGGLAIAIGELVDDAIVDVENVYRRLKENAALAEPRPILSVVFTASKEVRNSIVIATIIVVLVFLPLFFLPGIEGRLFVPIGIAYVISIIASLVVSLTLTPVLCSYLLGRKNGHEEKDGLLVRTLKTLDRSILERIIDRPKLILTTALAAVIAVFFLATTLGRSFLPSFNEGSAMVEIDLPAGTSLEASSNLAMQAEKSLLEIPEVVSTARRTGRAGDDEEALGVNVSELEVLLKSSKRSREAVFEDIRARVQAQLPEGGFAGVTQPISHRIDHILSGIKSQAAIKIYGADLRILRQQGAEIRNAIKDVGGIVDLRVEGQARFPQLKIFAEREELAKYGLMPGDLISSLETMLQGQYVSTIYDKDRAIPVAIRIASSSRDSLAKIKEIPIHTTPNGSLVKLGQVADAFETSGPNAIDRENQRRRIVVSFNSSGRDLESLMTEVQDRLSKNITLASGYHYEIDGQYKSQQRAMKLVLLLGLGSLIGIFAVLAWNFRSSFIALQVMLNIPLAFIGATVAIRLSGDVISVPSLVAFVTLCGIASRNGIMMISHYIHLMAEEGESFTKDMIIRGSLDRLVPVLMTALTAALALVPILFAKDAQGKEILYPVAVVIVGGLVSSTLLDIFVTPVVFYKFGRKSAERLASRKKNSKPKSLEPILKEIHDEENSDRNNRVRTHEFGDLSDTSTG